MQYEEGDLVFYKSDGHRVEGVVVNHQPNSVPRYTTREQQVWARWGPEESLGWMPIEAVHLVQKGNSKRGLSIFLEKHE